jgi:hypothetical protein
MAGKQMHKKQQYYNPAGHIDNQAPSASKYPKHRARTVLLFAASILLSGLVTIESASASPSSSILVNASFQKGMSFATWWEGQYSDSGSDISLERLKSTGANWISLIVTAYQDTYQSTAIDFASAHTPTDADLIHVINLAHSLGLKVMLKPHLDLRDESNGHWRGDIGTGFTTEAQWSAWFASYRSFIEHYARLAQTNGADQFSAGTELLGTTPRATDWRAVIADVRAIYYGPITYAALHGGEETSIAWWDAVDNIGVDAYYPLTTSTAYDPTEPELEAAWAKPKALLSNLAATWGKPILLTEVGYRSQHGCASRPWDSNAVSPTDLEEQAFAYEAAFKQLYGQPWLRGIFWWTWYADRFESGPCDESYSPYDKPAEDVVRKWYGGALRSVRPALFADYSRTMDIYVNGLAGGWENWSWGGSINQAATDQAHSAPQSTFASVGGFGALSLRRSTFNPNQYYWLEFYVRGGTATQPKLAVFFDSSTGTRLASVPVNDCRFIDGGTITSDAWKRVRIPVGELNVRGVDLSRLSIQDSSGQGASFWIDDLRFVMATSASNSIALPLVVK